MGRATLNRGLTKIVFVLLLAMPAFADVPPPVGYSSVPNGIELRPSGDLSGFRFFLTDLTGNIQEIDLSAGKKARIDGNGRGGAGSFGTVWAVPVGSVPQGALATDQLSELARDLQKNRVEGQVKLVSHTFRKEVVVLNASGEHYDMYDVVINGPGAKPVAHPSGSSTKGGWPWFWIMAGGGIAFVLAFIIITALAVLIYKRRARA